MRRDVPQLVIPGLISFAVAVALRGMFTSEMLTGSDLSFHYAWIEQLSSDTLPRLGVRGWFRYQWCGCPLFFFYGFLPHLVVAVLIRLLFFVPPLLVFNICVALPHILLPLTVYLYVREETNHATGVLAAIFSFFIMASTGSLYYTCRYGLWTNAVAVCLFPVQLLAARRLARDMSARNALLFIGSFVCCALTHLLSAGHFFALSLAYLAPTFLTANARKRGQIVAVFAFCVLLTAFWWGPGIVKRVYTHGSYETTVPYADTVTLVENLRTLWEHAALPHVLIPFCLIGLVVCAKSRSHGLFMVVLASLASSLGLIKFMLVRLGLAEVSVFVLMKAFPRYLAYTQIVLFLLSAWGIYVLACHRRWSRTGRTLLIGVTAVVLALPLGRALTTYVAVANCFTSVTPASREKAAAVAAALPADTRALVEFDRDSLLRQFDGLLFLRYMLAASGRSIVAGDANEQTILDSWPRAMGEHKTLTPEALQARCRLYGASHVVALSESFKSLLKQGDGMFRLAARVGDIEIHEVSRDVSLVAAARTGPTLVVTTLQRWQDGLSQYADADMQPFIVRSEKRLASYTSDELRHFHSIIVDDPDGPWGGVEIPVAVRVTAHCAEHGGDVPLDTAVVSDFVSAPDTPEFPLDSTTGPLTYLRQGSRRIAVRVDEPVAGVVVKESYFPNWSARLNGQPVHRLLALPSFMYIPVTDTGQLLLEFKRDAVDWLFLGVSLGALVLLLVARRRLFVDSLP